MGHLFAFAVGLLLSCSAFADSPLSPKFRNLTHPQNDVAFMPQGGPGGAPSKNDVIKVISQQSPVRSQDSRGTCSIFSATAALEGLLVRAGGAAPGVDLSEEWLQYLTTQENPEEGSTSMDNFRLLRMWGQPLEKSLPYGGQAWTSKASGLALRRCGYLSRGPKLKACLISHRDPDLLKKSDAELLDHNDIYYDPEFVAARNEALAMRSSFMKKRTPNDRIVTTVSEIHQLLAAGIPLTLDIDFFYGAWNYPGSQRKGVDRSKELWQSGTITYPEQGSFDRQVSKKSQEGHSVVVVGYDDDREVTYTMNMKNGKRQTFTRRGVYYIKNSWGSDDWGRDFKVEGKNLPGYGMILQDNAHEFGEFYHFDL